MRFLLPTLLLGLLPVHAADTPSDLLRFSNGDRLDGTFSGVKEGPVVLWKRSDVDQPVEFKSTQLRQAVLRGGHAVKPFADLSSVALNNGDRLPGTVIAMDASTVTIDTPYAGAVVVPRNRVGMIAPNPLGGKVIYSGPYSEAGWSIVQPKEDEAAAAAPPLNPAAPPPPKTEGEPAEKPMPAWSYSSGSYYSRSGNAGLIREVGMPERSLLRFQLAWKSRLALSVAFHADLVPAPEIKGGEDQKPMRQEFGGVQNYPKLFGNAYVMNLYPNYVILYRSGYDKDGKPVVERVQSGTTSIRLSETGEAAVEIRCNRHSGEISLFLNDEFAMQWTEGPEVAGAPYSGKGGSIGFQVQGLGAQVRISDLVVAEWNGMPDAARSLQTEDQDIVLLANGTDRFSGEVSGLNADKLQLKGRYGNFEFPMSEVAEVRFARNRLAKNSQPAADLVAVRFHPFGKISGKPSEGTSSSLTLASPIAGKMSVNLDYAVMLDFKNTNSFLDDWDPEF